MPTRVHHACAVGFRIPPQSFPPPAFHPGKPTQSLASLITHQSTDPTLPHRGIGGLPSAVARGLSEAQRWQDAAGSAEASVTLLPGMV